MWTFALQVTRLCGEACGVTCDVVDLNRVDLSSSLRDPQVGNYDLQTATKPPTLTNALRLCRIYRDALIDCYTYLDEHLSHGRGFYRRSRSGARLPRARTSECWWVIIKDTALSGTNQYSAPRRGHGSSDTFFDAPTESTFRLKPRSKLKSAYSFGRDGTLGWTTPAGELLSVASSIDERLVGIEFKKSIELGQDYHQRGKMLARAVKASQGSGYGIGLSLDMEINSSQVSWVYNRWPRYTYQHDGLEIRLQYYVESQSVIQQYQIRNNGQEDASLPYVITSDVCFRKHQWPAEAMQPVPSTKCPERLLIVQNSEVLIRNPTYQAQFKNGAFSQWGKAIALDR